LLNTSPPTPPRASDVTDDTAKVRVIAETSKDKPRTNKLPSENAKKSRTLTPEANGPPDGSNENTQDFSSKANMFPGRGDENSRTFTPEANGFSDEGKEKPLTSRNRNRNRRLREAKAEGAYLWETMTGYLLRPEMMGGCVGLVNLGLLAGLGRAFYAKPHLRKDTAFILQTAAAAVGLLFVEGYAAERHRQTPRRSEEDRREKKGVLVYEKVREVVFRPGVLGGLMGLLNASVIGTLGYLAFTNWDRPHWSRRHLSSITVGLIALVSGEGWLAEQYRK